MLSQIGEVIRFHRKRAGLSQLELATLAGIGKAAVFDMEHGTKSTRLDTLAKVLKILNIEITWQSPLMAEFEESHNEESSDQGSR